MGLFNVPLKGTASARDVSGPGASRVQFTRNNPGVLDQDYPEPDTAWQQRVSADFSGDRSLESWPDWNDRAHRELENVPDQPVAEYGYNELPHSRTVQIDYGGVPGTVSQNIYDGPVTGEGIEHWEVGERTTVPVTPPHYDGPVDGGIDYSQTLAGAYYQADLEDYNSDMATDALVAES